MKGTFYIQRENLFIVPVCHYQAEFSDYVRRAVLDLKPDVIAVELPSTLEDYIIEAVGRFPYLSVIFYQNGKGEYIYFPIEPSDPLAEAIRTGLEMGIPTFCIDLDTDDYPLVFDPMPDSYSVFKLGLKTYYHLYKAVVESGKKPAIKTSQDDMREEAMAYQLQKMLRGGKKVLFVCGIVHVQQVMEKLKRPCVQPIGKVIREDLTIYNLSLESIREVTGEIPFLMSVYEMARGNHDLEKEITEFRESQKTEELRDLESRTGEKQEKGKLISLDDERKKLRFTYPPEIKKNDDSPVKISGISEDLPLIEPSFVLPSPFSTQQKKKQENVPDNIAYLSGGSPHSGFQWLRKTKKKDQIPATLDYSSSNNDFQIDKNANLMPGSPAEVSRGQTRLERDMLIFQSFMKRIFGKLFSMPESNPVKGNLDPKREKEFFNVWLSDLEKNPFKTGKEIAHKFRNSSDRWEELMRFYKKLAEDNPDRDRQVILVDMLRKAAQYYQENVNEEIARWQFRIFMKYSCNYARVTGRLLPDLYQMVICARSCADDNFAHEVWDLATFYPWIDKSTKYQTIDIRADEVWLFGRKITLRRKFPYLRKRLMPVKERRNEKHPGEWAKKFDGTWICSYPPEDLVIENYGTYLRKKGINILTEDQTRVVPFTTSLLDGIDIRETLRNWHEKKIYVREQMHMSGGVGSVVIIFDEDLDDRNFPWKLTWLGEHHQESDMALYSSPPQDKIIGPGISRCTYGGIMMTYPPGRIWDVWGDPLYSVARTKSEVLLMAAVEYSLEKNVVYVSAKPPRSYFQSFANRLNKRIIYIPIGSLSPVTLKKIRVFHVLAGHRVREYARDYIW